MAEPINLSDTLTTHPTSIDDTHSVYPGTFYSTNVLDNCFTDASSSTRAAFYTTTGSNAETKVYLNFDACADIPSGATINSISCSVKCGTQGTNYFGTRTVQMCTGTTTKGSATTMSGSNSSPTTHTLTVGSWTGAEIQNAKLYFHVVRGTSNTTTDATFSVFGATLTVSYTFSGTQYLLTATSEINDITITPVAANVISGGSQEFTINPGSNTTDDFVVEDNGTDVTSSLIEHSESGGTISAYPESYTTSGSIRGTNYQSAVGKGADAASASGNDYCQSNGSTAYINYSFDFSDIPVNATIDSVTVQVKGHCESTSQSSEVARLQLYSGSTAKGSESNFTSTSDTVVTMTPGTWTRSELQQAVLRFTIGYYGGRVVGATWTVIYSVAASTYYTYTVSNVQADHDIVISAPGAFIPPEEDPQKTYYPITISSINAITDPGSGTTRVESGTNQTITITPSDPQLTLALDNGVDITSQLVGGTPTNTYTVTTQVSGASYGFSLNSSTGYYVSTNNGVAKSASVARLNMDFESSCLVTITYINYAEANYDYGMFGKLDTAVATDGLTASSGSSSPSDSTSNYELAMCSNSSSTQTITYQVPAGEHFIDIKYGKDDGTNSNNDTLQWKVTSVEATSAGGDYTYTLSNVSAKHSLIFVFGNVSYYFVTSSISTSDARLYPDGQMVKLEGHNYDLTIVPNDPTATVTLTDNNVDVTSSLGYEEGTDKYNNLVVNYTYKLTNIQATHSLVVTCTSPAVLYLKSGGAWVQVSKAYQKVNGSWTEIAVDTAFDSRLNYKRGS